MIIDIISHTPLWVFILLFILVLLGYSQTKDRVVSQSKIFILPTSMILLSFIGTLLAFNNNLLSILLWLTGISISLIVVLNISHAKDIFYNQKKNEFHIKGSIIPLILMLSIFFLKYFIGVVTVKKPLLINQIEFIVIISLLYGLISGIFLARSIWVFRSKRQ